MGTTWKLEDIFPLLDLLRWFLSTKPSNIHKTNLNQIYGTLSRYLEPEITTLSFKLILKILANFFLMVDGERIMIQNREILFGKLNSVIENIEGDLDGQVEL